MKPEAQVSRDIRDFLVTVGFAVWSTEQGYRKERGGTRTTPGFPDLCAIGHNRVLFIECKAPGRENAMSDAQRAFASECNINGVPHLVASDTRQVFDWLVELGVLQGEAA